MILEIRDNYAIAEIERAGMLIYVIVPVEHEPTYASGQSRACFGFPDSKGGDCPPTSLSRALAYQLLERI